MHPSSLTPQIVKIKLTLNARVAILDLFAITRRIMDDPERYGFDPRLISTRCLVGVYTDEPRSLCDQPERHVFYDDFHPTAKLHAEIGREAAMVIRRLRSDQT